MTPRKNPEETRRRIVEATVSLHEEVGPADTTITAIAERAGVQRLTVYRHFPDDHALLQACSSHWNERHPPPDPAEWSGLEDPDDRLRRALTVLYAFFEEGQAMIGSVLQDEDEMEAVAQVTAPFHEYLREIAGTLAAGWGVDGDAQRRVRAATGHAVDFRAWQSLSDQDLDREEAVELMARWVRTAAGHGARTDG